MTRLPSWSIALLVAGCGGPQEGGDPETCYDAVDNDADGRIDCGDDGCAEAMGCPDDPAGAVDPEDRFCINEFMAVNRDTSVGLEDDTGSEAYPDWIELYSFLDRPLDLEGYTLTDELDNPDRHVLGDLTLPARGFLLLYADEGEDDGAEHLSFALSSQGEEIGVYTPYGDPIDLLEYGEQAADRSAARIPDGTEDAWQITVTPTPGAPNAAR